jgi:hypothetical protein
MYFGYYAKQRPNSAVCINVKAYKPGIWHFTGNLLYLTSLPSQFD